MAPPPAAVLVRVPAPAIDAATRRRAGGRRRRPGLRRSPRWRAGLGPRRARALGRLRRGRGRAGERDDARPRLRNLAGGARPEPRRCDSLAAQQVDNESQIPEHPLCPMFLCFCNSGLSNRRVAFGPHMCTFRPPAPSDLRAVEHVFVSGPKLHFLPRKSPAKKRQLNIVSFVETAVSRAGSRHKTCCASFTSKICGDWGSASALCQWLPKARCHGFGHPPSVTSPPRRLRNFGIRAETKENTPSHSRLAQRNMHPRGRASALSSKIRNV